MGGWTAGLSVALESADSEASVPCWVVTVKVHLPWDGEHRHVGMLNPTWVLCPGSVCDVDGY
jgi:hypothetical protein